MNQTVLTNQDLIAPDLTKNIKTSLKTAIGQLGYVMEQLDNAGQAGNILLQLKAVQSTLNKTTFELLDDAYRKALAEKLSANYRQCPGNCGHEKQIQELIKLFPEFNLEDIPGKLNEALSLEKKLLKFLAEKNLDTPRGDG